MLAFNGKELTRNYVVNYAKTVEVGGQQVALFDVGDGGNQCGTATVIVWKPENGAVESAVAGDDCGSPPAAVTEQSIYFVPFLLPGASKPAQMWTPSDGLRVAGTLAFTPQPGTDWKDLDPAKLHNIVDAFDNEAVYAAGKQLLGDAITDVATGLLVGGARNRRRPACSTQVAACRMLAAAPTLSWGSTPAATSSISRSKAKIRMRRPGRPSRSGPLT